MPEVLLDAAGRRRSPATIPTFHAGRSPRNKAQRYQADLPTITEIVAVMRHAGDQIHGHRLRGLIAVLWRAGLRINEALALNEADLDARRGSLLVRRGKGGRRREVGMDDWAWQQIQPWPPHVWRSRSALVLYRHRTDARANVVGCGCPRAAPPNGRAGRRAPPLRPSPPERDRAAPVHGSRGVSGPFA
jgi:integrase